MTAAEHRCRGMARGVSSCAGLCDRPHERLGVKVLQDWGTLLWTSENGACHAAANPSCSSASAGTCYAGSRCTIYRSRIAADVQLSNLVTGFAFFQGTLVMREPAPIYDSMLGL